MYFVIYLVYKLVAQSMIAVSTGSILGLFFWLKSNYCGTMEAYKTFG